MRHDSENDFDIELVLAMFNGSVIDFASKLPHGYVAEDWQDKGCGLAIRKDMWLSDSLDQAIQEFIKPLLSLKDEIKDQSAILRIGVFNKNFIFRCTIVNIEQLSVLNVTIDLSVYPTSEED